MPYDAVIFDNDGVLVELTDRDVLREATREAFASMNVLDPAAEHVEDIHVGVTPSILRRVADHYDVDPHELWAARDSHLSAAQQEAVRAGEKSLYDDVDHVTSLDVPRGIVSSNQHETVEFVLDHYGLRDHFDTYYGRDPTVESLRKKKPDPHYLHRAMDDIGSENPLFVGDSESDVRAAANAGVDSAFVRRPHRAETALSADPTHELTGLADLRGLVE